MKKLARVLGLLGGVAAVAWAMRDRFVSIASPREPEPPSFRVVTPPSSPPSTPPTGPAPVPPPTRARSHSTEPDDLTAVIGIGPVFARRLMEAGIATFSDLANASPARVAEVVGVPESRVTNWIEQAGQRA